MTLSHFNDAFFYDDMGEDRPYCPPLRHDDDPEPFFRGGGQELFLNDNGKIVDGNGKPTYWLTHSLIPESERRETFCDPWDAALALLLNEDAWFLGHCYLKFDYRECLCRPTTVP
jgi:hypothetical protein